MKWPQLNKLWPLFNQNTEWLPGLILSGISIGLVMPSISASAVFGLPSKDYAVGSAINHAVRQIGTVIGVAMTVVLLAQENLEFTNFLPFIQFILFWHSLQPHFVFL